MYNKQNNPLLCPTLVVLVLDYLCLTLIVNLYSGLTGVQLYNATGSNVKDPHYNHQQLEQEVLLFLGHL